MKNKKVILSLNTLTGRNSN